MNFLRHLALQENKLDDSSRLDVVEIARISDMLPSLFLSVVGLRTYQHPGNTTHALCMLYEKGYRQTLRICNINCISTVAVLDASAIILLCT